MQCPHSGPARIPFRLLSRFAKPERTRTCKSCNAAWANSLLFGDHSFFPSPWVAVLVEKRDKLHGFSGHSEVHRVRKPAKQSSSNVVFDFRKLKWAFDDPSEDGIELVEEFITQSRPSLLVPCCRVADIKFSLGQDREASHHGVDWRWRSLARSSSRKSSQDLPS